MTIKLGISLEEISFPASRVVCTDKVLIWDNVDTLVNVQLYDSARSPVLNCA
jgi:hypothetical protein